MSGEPGAKYLTVADLRALLAEVPDSWMLHPNTVGNVGVYGPDFTFRGWIDFLPEGGNVEWNEGEPK